MVTWRMVDTVPIIEMNTTRSFKLPSSKSCGFRLLDNNVLESTSSVGQNSVYKSKIDLMFDSTRSSLRNRFNDTRGSHRTRSIIMYGRSELASAEESFKSISNLLQESKETTKRLTKDTKNNVKRVSNSVQEQIEQLFTDVAKDATSSFAVIYLGSLPLKDKITSLQGLQEPLRELYLKELNTKCSGFLEICATGLRVKLSSNYGKETNDENITPFHNIAVWSAVKFIQSRNNGGAAFLPLMTDPENIDKTSLFRPLCGSEKNNGHAPIFTVVMRSAGLPKILKCHAFICKCTEDAIVIAATLYQSLMAYVTSSYRNTKTRTPRNQNGVSCISIASSSVRTGSNYLSNSQAHSNGRKSSLPSSNISASADVTSASRVGRQKRIPSISLNSSNNVTNKVETTTEERKRTFHKSKRAPPIPHGVHSSNVIRKNSAITATELKGSLCNSCEVSQVLGGRDVAVAESLGCNTCLRSETNGDILTRVAIPRSGSFLNTGGLTRYKSRAARRHSGKLGGGNGSPLGFSELFNEFRLHENLHSLDEILYAIIDADGMSFNDLKPIYKEFLLKLAVTLTKDELFQRSKNIMRRQRKKKLKVRSSTLVPQKKLKPSIFGTKSLKKVFQLDQFRSCRGKLLKLEQKNKYEARKRDSMEIMGNQNFAPGHQSGEQHARPATSGSEASIVRKDNTIHGFHRHSSSGYVAGTTSNLSDYNDCNCSYVSCSGCSYDSGSCTCTSADRCYCSLRTYHVNNRLLRNYEDNLVLSKSSTNINRDSLISCKSDDKCYCSMVEEVNENVGGDFGNNQSDTTWCDTDSCISTSKCYCKHVNGGKKSECVENNTSISCQGNSSIRTTGENLALDYELFTISDNGKSVQPHEALSVKKSVEAAAIFADVKLNQTTDIKSMFPSNLAISKIPIEDWSNADGSKQKKALKELDTSSMDRRHNKNQDFILSANSTHISHSADDLLCKLEVLQTNSESESIKSASNKFRTTLSEAENRQSFRNNKLINASLEDTLGYLP